MRVMLAGQMARDEALAERLYMNCELSVASPEPNPGLVDKVLASGGHYYTIPTIRDSHAIADATVQAKSDMFISHSDDALEADVAGIVTQHIPDIMMASPDRAAARAEWDKNYLRQLVAEINPSYNPIYFSINTPEQLDAAIAQFMEVDGEIAVKPNNLSGGKGVKVMGPHLSTYEDVQAYGLQVLADPNQDGLLLEERLVGPEFTIQGITDGKTLIIPPATYDYPYREDGDKGPGTGGVGSFTMADGLMPFLEQADYDEAANLMRQILDKFLERGLDYKGVLYGSFFKTSKGLKIVEINARGGDPELVNTLDLLEDDISMLDVYRQIATGELSPDSIRYKRMASAVIYLVSPDYAYKKESHTEFEFDPDIVALYGCKTRFAGARRSPSGINQYSAGASRIVGISALAATPWEARQNIMKAIRYGVRGPLDFRRDVAEEDYIRNLNRIFE